MPVRREEGIIRYMRIRRSIGYEAYVDRHLYTRLRASALKHDVKPVGLVELLERGHDRLLAEPHRLVGSERLRLVPCREAVHLVCEAVRMCEFEARPVDVEGDDALGAFCAREHASEQADGTDTEDENSVARGDTSPSRCVDENAERFRECCLLEGNVVGNAREQV